MAVKELNMRQKTSSFQLEDVIEHTHTPYFTPFTLRWLGGWGRGGNLHHQLNVGLFRSWRADSEAATPFLKGPRSKVTIHVQA